jgi:hypothetical protein
MIHDQHGSNLTSGCCNPWWQWWPQMLCTHCYTVTKSLAELTSSVYKRAFCSWRGAVAGMPDAATYRDVCVALRQEHDKEVAISQQLQVRLPVQELCDANMCNTWWICRRWCSYCVLTCLHAKAPAVQDLHLSDNSTNSAA